jgi:hypothetical protein
MTAGAVTIARASQEASSGLFGSPLALTALAAWLLTAGIGAYMLRTWVTRGGRTDEMIARLLASPSPGRRRRKLRLAPLIPVGHGFAP